MKKAFAGFLLVFILSVSLLSANEITVKSGGTAGFSISYDRPWKIEFDGLFDGKHSGHWVAKRFIYDGGNNASLDLFEFGRFRLGNRKVFLSMPELEKYVTAGKGAIIGQSWEIILDNIVLESSLTLQPAVAVSM